MIEKGIETVLKDETHTEASSSAAAAEQPQQQPSKSKLKAKANAKGKGLIPLSISIAMFVLGSLIGGSVTHGVYTLKARNGSATIASESIAVAVAPPTNPGTITLEGGGGMIISGSVKLPADVKVIGDVDGITLVDGAVLDCNQHSITGDETGENIGIYVKGVGAKVKITNCPAVTKLNYGALLEGDGQDVVIENSSFDYNIVNGILMGNTKAGGRLVMNDVSASNTKAGRGMELNSWDTIELNKIVANGNNGNGATFKGQDVTIENSSFDHNSGVYGIKINLISSSRTLVLKGKNSFDNNVGYGLYIAGQSSSSRATVLVDGKVTANDNVIRNIGGTGIFARYADFEIKKGSVEACGNRITDITSNSATFSGKKYICDDTKGTGVPVCKPCRDGKARKLGVSN
jgi:hypothetical protein